MRISKKMSVFVCVRLCSSVLPKTIIIIAIFAMCTSRSFAKESLKEKAIKLGFDKIVFCARGPGYGTVFSHWYENIGQNTAFTKDLYGGKGGWLYCLSLKSGKLTTIMEDNKGDIRDPFVHRSAKKILFAYRKGDRKQYHLCEINPDGTNFKKITNDVYFDDIEPIYLPNDDIVFTSSRSKHFTPCWNVRATTLYRCSPNGTNITAISANTAVDNTPWLLNDGRILMMQWDYVNRTQMSFHHLFTVNPDGTGRKVFYGGMTPGGVFIDAKPLPNSQKIILSHSKGHGLSEHAGEIGIFNPKVGPDTHEKYSYGKRTQMVLEKIHPKLNIKVMKKAKQLGYTRWPTKLLYAFLLYRDPYPLSEKLFLVATGDRIILADADSNIEILYELEKGNDFKDIIGDIGNNYNEIWLHEPRPIKERKPKPMIPSVVDPNKKTGTMILANIYHGRNMIGIKKGSIKKLLVYEDLPKPFGIGNGHDFSLSGSFFLHRFLGVVPVEDDGSAYFEVPANSALWFVALDKNDKAVKWMQNFVNLIPGETVGCVGCHENRTETHTSSNVTLKALTRPISKIEKIEGIPDIFDYPRDIQPIWDKHCISCHNSEKRAGKVEMTGDKAPKTNISFANLRNEYQLDDGYDSHGNLSARTMGTGSSKLMNKIDGSHHNVKLSELEFNKVRIWLDSGVTYSGTLASLDGAPAGKVNHAEIKKIAQKLCVKCHKNKSYPFARKIDKTKFKTIDFPRSGLAMFNLTNIEKSLLLRKPLAQQAGGIGEKENHPVIFKSTKDPIYQKFYNVLKDAQKSRLSGARFDTPNYVVGDIYIRNMQDYGILPKNIKAKDVDPYETDKKYIESFHPENKIKEITK